MITWSEHAFGRRCSLFSALLYWASNLTDNAMYAILVPEYVGKLFDAAAEAETEAERDVNVVLFCFVLCLCCNFAVSCLPCLLFN